MTRPPTAANSNGLTIREGTPMLQDFRRRTTPDTGAARGSRRCGRAMAEAGVDAFLVPRADAHQGENVAPRDERLAWLTGFTGSAGLAVVTAERAAIFVDGRYRLQVRGQVDPDALRADARIPRTSRPTGWPRRCRGGGRLGFDPWLHTAKEVEALDRGARAAADRAGAGREPRRPRSGPTSRRRRPRPIVPHPVELAGRDSRRQARRARPRPRRARPRGGGADAARLDRLAPQRPRLGHRPHAGAARLRDPRTPTAGSSSSPTPRKADDALARASRPGGQPVAAPEAFGPALDALRGPGRRSTRRARRSGSPTGSPPPGAAEVVWERDPCILPKALQEPGRDRRRPRRAPARRRGDGRVPRLARRDRARGRADRDRRGDAARGDPRRHRRSSATSPSRRSAAPGRTARSCTTASPRPRTARSRRASSCSSTAARSTSTAPPTSPAPSRSGRCRRRRSGRSRWC